MSNRGLISSFWAPCRPKIQRAVPNNNSRSFADENGVLSPTWPGTALDDAGMAALLGGGGDSPAPTMPPPDIPPTALLLAPCQGASG